MSEPDWPPRISAIGLADGEQRRGSTGQLFEARHGQWVRVHDGLEHGNPPPGQEQHGIGHGRAPGQPSGSEPITRDGTDAARRCSTLSASAPFRVREDNVPPNRMYAVEQFQDGEWHTLFYCSTREHAEQEAADQAAAPIPSASAPDGLEQALAYLERIGGLGEGFTADYECARQAVKEAIAERRRGPPAIGQAWPSEEQRAVLKEMRDIRFGCSGKTLLQVNDWFNERARSLLAAAPPAQGSAQTRVVNLLREAVCYLYVPAPDEQSGNRHRRTELITDIEAVLAAPPAQGSAAPEMLDELRQCAVELEEASKLLKPSMPGCSDIYRKAEARTRALIAKASVRPAPGEIIRSAEMG